MKYIESNKFTVEDLGVQEIDVYDIEVDDNHNFFANDILVHNSVYLNLSDVVDKWTKTQNNKGITLSEEDKINFLDAFCSKVLEPLIEKTYIELSEYMNSAKQKMSMKRESLADVSVFCGKKKYAMNVWDSEGVRYTEPKIKIVGLEAVKSSTPEFMRKKLKEAIPILFYGTNDDLRNYVTALNAEFNALPVETIAFPKGVNDIEKYVNEKGEFGKGTPINVRAASVYNSLLKQNNLEDNYTPIVSGDKMKFTYLRTPNPIRQNVIGFNTELPKQFKLHEYVDYDTMFEKVFLASMKIMSDPLQWTLEPESSLKGFF